MTKKLIKITEVFQTEHHVYSIPFRYANVTVNGWVDKSDAGIELLADKGTLTINEKKPIVEVIVVGSGVSLPNHNIVEWWGEGEGLNTRNPGEPIKRQIIGNLSGQHPTAYHRSILGSKREYRSPDEAKRFSACLREHAYNLTRGFTIPGSLPGRFYENTARFRIGDTSKEKFHAYRVTIRAGGKNYGDPSCLVHHHSNYAIRLVDVVVLKDGPAGVHMYSDHPGEELPGEIEGRPIHTSPKDDERLGELRKPEVFITEHHEYSVPWHYPNVVLNGWLEYGDKGTELYGEKGTIIIQEDKPIVAVTSVFSGCASPNYNLLEWWGDDEGERWRKTKRLPVDGRLIKRQRVDNLKGQHPTSEMSVFLGRMRDTEENLANKLHDLSHNHHFPTVSIMNGLFENVAYFRIGDTSRSDQTVYKVVLRGGGLDMEDPYGFNARFPADFVSRLIDVEVRKEGPLRAFAPLSPDTITEADVWTDEERLEKFRELNKNSMIPFPEEWSMRKRSGPKINGIPFLKYGFAHFAPRDNWMLGKMRQPERFEIEHRVYSVPFDYVNVKVEGALNWNEQGLVLPADAGRILIEEDKPIVAVSVVGSGAASGSYVIFDWSVEGNAIWNPKDSDNDSQLPRRIRIDDLNGQYPSALHEALIGQDATFDTVKEATAFLAKLRNEAVRVTEGFYFFEGLWGGLYENTAVARIGDTSRLDQTAFRVVITAGALGGSSNPGTIEERYPGDYKVRLIDVMVRKD